MCVCVCIHRKKVTQSCLTLCEPTDCSLPGSSVHGISSKDTGVGCHFLLLGIFLHICVCAKSLQSCLFVTLWTTVHQLPCVFLCVCSVVSSFLQPQENYSPPGSIVRGILQARILEWAVISFPREPSRSRDLICVSCISGIGRYILYQYVTLEIPIYVSIFMPVLTNTE